MKIRKRSAVFASVSDADLDKEFESDFDSTEDSEALDEGFPESKSDNPKSEYLKLFNKAIDDVESAIQSLVKSNAVSVQFSEDAAKASKECVKDLAVVLAELQLAQSEAKK